jgi:hypothetical protein
MPMSRNSALRGRGAPPKPLLERRRNVRFPITLPVRYAFSKGCGWGRILNIGSGGALFTVDKPVKAGDGVELCIGWPVLLHAEVHLNLVACGAIVRTEEGCAAVRFEQFRFRTASAAFRQQANLPELLSGAQSHG